MFELCLQKKFDASHALIGGDWGSENFPHVHHYKLEWILEAPKLGVHRYIADLVELEEVLEQALKKYRGLHLNDLAVFGGENPSLEIFAKILWEDLFGALKGRGIAGGKVILWEHEEAWASYRGTL